VSPRGLRRGQVNFRSHNSCFSLGAPSPGRRRACVLFEVSFQGEYSPTGLPGDTVWLALPPTGRGGLSVLSHHAQPTPPPARIKKTANCHRHQQQRPACAHNEKPEQRQHKNAALAAAARSPMSPPPPLPSTARKEVGRKFLDVRKWDGGGRGGRVVLRPSQCLWRTP